jgi:hypothetical protein
MFCRPWSLERQLDRVQHEMVTSDEEMHHTTMR